MLGQRRSKPYRSTSQMHPTSSDAAYASLKLFREVFLLGLIQSKAISNKEADKLLNQSSRASHNLIASGCRRRLCPCSTAVLLLLPGAVTAAARCLLPMAPLTAVAALPIDGSSNYQQF
ncbi:hypothetical protein FRX31_032520 [Thalictrum thalictroides]|uniref:Uncharacterized protein n=1 Tax=Thalictrum thalictroides TaxID=46969 RepID=A0A7J6UYZ8_THATH|nr:hypothetical protein FRX31_032520 [Thalictrum thalictroides]